MEIVDFFFYLHDLVLNGDDDDIQDDYCKLYKFHVRFVKTLQN